MSFKSAFLAVIMMSSVGVLVTGCGNACDDAVDKLKDCGVSNVQEADECSEQAECAAACTEDASCDEIKAATLDGPYFACVAKCQ